MRKVVPKAVPKNGNLPEKWITGTYRGIYRGDGASSPSQKEAPIQEKLFG
jgi:hypothetical protein